MHRTLQVAIIGLSVAFSLSAASVPDEGLLRAACFQADITPPLGSPLCCGLVMPAKEIVTSLTARGVVLLGADQPIVLCALDWVGVGNESYDAFRKDIAQAAGTLPERVAVHALHPHDAPGSDFAAERLLAEQGLGGRMSNPEADRLALGRIVEAVRAALPAAQTVTQIGLGTGRVEQVASNRRILDADGKRVVAMRWGSCRDPKLIAAPEGVIDPLVWLVALWHEDKPIAVFTYYASHPHSFYGKGGVSWEFVGEARALREQVLPGVPHIHFCGAGGNVAAGKYNDGSPENRPVLAGRLAEGMRLAWESQQKVPLRARDVAWKVVPVTLPVRDGEGEAELVARLSDAAKSERERIEAARLLTFSRRMAGGAKIPISCLWMGDARVVHMPGELFVEYQLGAQSMRPSGFVAMAAYGDYGPGYIGTERAYGEGGYETGPASRTAPQVEKVLMDAVRQVMGGARGR
jgi:hypothetical protein